MTEEEFGAIRRAVFPQCMKLLCNEADAEDMTQAAIAAYLRLEEPIESPLFWILKVARNLSINELRIRDRRGEQLDEESLVSHASDGELIEFLRESVPASELSVLWDRSEGKTIGEIAEDRSVSFAQARGLINRSRRKAVSALAIIGITSGFAFSACGCELDQLRR